MTGRGKAAQRRLRKAAELSGVCLGICALAALNALNAPALLACALLEEAVLGLW